MTTEPDDRAPDDRQHRFDHRSGGEEQASVGLEHHDLVRREFDRGIDLDEVAVGVEDLVDAR